MRKLVFQLTLTLLITIFIISFISATCTEEQIDINTASLQDLDKLYGIGPAKARAIVDTRPFDSVDDLIGVYGIGEATLNGIKTQGLACVENEDSNEIDEKNVEEESVVEKNRSETKTEEVNSQEESETELTGNTVQPETKETIILNPLDTKVIKTEEDKGLQKNIPVYGF